MLSAFTRWYACPQSGPLEEVLSTMFGWRAATCAVGVSEPEDEYEREAGECEGVMAEGHVCT